MTGYHVSAYHCGNGRSAYGHEDEALCGGLVGCVPGLVIGVEEARTDPAQGRGGGEEGEVQEHPSLVVVVPVALIVFKGVLPKHSLDESDDHGETGNRSKQSAMAPSDLGKKSIDLEMRDEGIQTWGSGSWCTGSLI